VERIAVERARGQIGRGAEPCVPPDIVAGYLSDASGRLGHAEALYRPENEADVAAIVRSADRQGIALTVVAAQTSTTASSVPEGGWVLSTEKLARQMKLDAAHGTVRCAAGERLGAFQDSLLAEGWLYPPDPTSRYECTLGGSVACNASGPRSLRFGATRRWVRALRVVLACGEVLSLRRGDHVAALGGGFEVEHTADPSVCGFAARADLAATAIPVPRVAFPHDLKHATGYLGGSELDLIDLFIGSEGTLGVISEVEVELLPRPEPGVQLFVCFDREAAALDLVESARHAGRSHGRVRPDSLEWFDRASLDLIEAERLGLDFPGEAQVGLFIEQLGEPKDPGADLALEGWFALLRECGADLDARDHVRVALSAAEREVFRNARHAVPTGVNELAARNGMPKLGTDLAVADEHLRDVVALYHRAAQDPLGLLDVSGRHALSESSGYPARLDAVTFGHVGDNHLHMNFLPVDARGRELAEHVYAELTRRVIGLGGSPSAEHGIGKLKRAALRQRVGEAGFADMLRVKRALDPRGILGRGNLFEADVFAP